MSSSRRDWSWSAVKEDAEPAAMTASQVSETFSFSPVDRRASKSLLFHPEGIGLDANDWSIKHETLAMWFQSWKFQSWKFQWRPLRRAKSTWKYSNKLKLIESFHYRLDLIIALTVRSACLPVDCWFLGRMCNPHDGCSWRRMICARSLLEFLPPVRPNRHRAQNDTLPINRVLFKRFVRFDNLIESRPIHFHPIGGEWRMKARFVLVTWRNCWVGRQGRGAMLPTPQEHSRMTSSRMASSCCSESVSKEQHRRPSVSTPHVDASLHQNHNRPSSNHVQVASFNRYRLRHHQ